MKLAGAVLVLLSSVVCAAPPPNILLAISDDQSYLHTSAAGWRAVATPAFDRIAREGVLFRNAFAASPGCSPSRAALLTGRQPWQLGEAGTHSSGFPTNYVVLPDLLEAARYAVGMTGKGWAPGNWKVSGRTRNPAGPEYNRRTADPPHREMSRVDYAANFEEFLSSVPRGTPFYFWYGAHEPHRPYAPGSGRAAGKQREQALPPRFLPDLPDVRDDLLDYAAEIEWFDRHLARMLELLERRGELDRTMIIVTSDNGMPFPRAKANVYEYGIHVPLAIRWGDGAPGGRVVHDLISLVDVAPTVLEAAGVRPPADMPPWAGRSFLNVLTNSQSGWVDPSRVEVWAGRERHSSARHDNLSYPVRALRTPDFLYNRNFRPDRWPAGDPVLLRDDGTPAGPHSGYKDIDESPTLAAMIARADDSNLGRFLDQAVALRPAEELYDIRVDPDCLWNLAGNPDYRQLCEQLRRRLEEYLRTTGDPRVTDPDGGEVWETYPRYAPIRRFPSPSAHR